MVAKFKNPGFGWRDANLLRDGEQVKPVQFEFQPLLPRFIVQEEVLFAD